MTSVIIRTSVGAYYNVEANITSIPPEAWPGDPRLDIRYNTILRIPMDAFISYSNLKTIYFEHVGLRYIEEGGFNGQDKLEKITIIGGYRSLKLPSNLGPPTRSLISIYLWNTLRDETATVYPYFKAFEKLNYLNIGSNFLKTFKANSLPNNLKTIVAPYTKIPIFPSLGIYAPLLQKIEMRKCGMDAMPVQNLAGLTDVKTLNLYGNTLSHLPDIAFMKDLKDLQLHRNRLTSMPDLYELPLTTLTLADNPLVCDKALCWLRMWPWMKASTIPSDEPTCAGPATVTGMRLRDVDPALMECFRGEFCNSSFKLSLSGVKLASYGIPPERTHCTNPTIHEPNIYIYVCMFLL